MFVLVFILNLAQQRKGKESEGTERQVSQILGGSISLLNRISNDSLLCWGEKKKERFFGQEVDSLLLVELQHLYILSLRSHSS